VTVDLKLIRVGNAREVDGILSRMKLLYAMDHCPQCGLLPKDHDDDGCEMRHVEEYA
jgi:hypothetical protein